MFHLEKDRVIYRHLKPYKCANFNYFSEHFANLFFLSSQARKLLGSCFEFLLLLTSGGDKALKVQIFDGVF